MKIEFEKHFCESYMLPFHFCSHEGLYIGVNGINKNHSTKSKSLFGMYGEPGSVVNSNIHHPS